MCFGTFPIFLGCLLSVVPYNCFIKIKKNPISSIIYSPSYGTLYYLYYIQFIFLWLEMGCAPLPTMNLWYYDAPHGLSSPLVPLLCRWSITGNNDRNKSVSPISMTGHLHFVLLQVQALQWRSKLSDSLPPLSSAPSRDVSCVGPLQGNENVAGHPPIGPYRNPTAYSDPCR